MLANAMFIPSILSALALALLFLVASITSRGIIKVVGDTIAAV